MNKKGQVDQTITSIVVFVAVFILMSVFVVISGNIGNAKNIRDNDMFSQNSDLLFNKINVDINGISKEMFVFEAIIIEYRGDIQYEAIREAFTEILNPQDNCLILIQNSEITFLKYIGGTVVEGDISSYNYELFPEYSGLMTKTSFFDAQSGKTLYLEYYKGECMEIKHE